MGWFKVDDSYFDHEKVEIAGDDASHLNLRGMAYCSRLQTDGRIPIKRLPKLWMERSDLDELAEDLIEAGLWRKTSKHYVIHDYLKHQSSREQIRAKQQAASARKRRSRERHAVTDDVSHANVTEPETEADTDTDVEPEADIDRITPRITTSLTALPPTAVEIQRTPDEVKAAIRDAGLNPTPTKSSVA